MPKLLIASVNPVNKLFKNYPTFTHLKHQSIVFNFNFYFSQFFPKFLNTIIHNFLKLIYSVKSGLINNIHTTYIKNYYIN